MVIQVLKIFFLFTFLFITSFNFVNGQENKRSLVKGKVFDTKTNKPMQSVNVSILGTLKGAATDRNGNFIIRNVPNSSFYIVVSYVGYETQKHSIKIVRGSIIKRDFFLEKRIFKLDEVTIDDESNSSWRRNFNIFNEQFIGVLKNSTFTQILNPYIINFSTTSDGWLSAETDEPIIIRNEILGYEIKYYLDTFLYQFPTVMYSGQPFFEEIKINDESSYTEIEKTRMETYCGSLRHFLYVAAKQYIQDSIKNTNVKSEEKDTEKNSLLKKHGFKVYTENSFVVDENVVRPIVYPADMNTFFSVWEDNSQLYLKFPHKLKIVYSREYEDEKVYNKIRESKNSVKRRIQTSWVVLPSHSALIDTTGYYFDSFNIQTFGYWFYDRVSNMLPYEYSLPDSILENYSLDEL